ncbi:MAG: hypothetical protein LBT46_02385 [Planctomycetaceae bacterium]|jgi:hypothetical protein|nr:hypothetical protein [Planctomycetaceae bacterium]
MANWYYYDNDLQKQGPINGTQVKILAGNGRIRPDTIMENETGQQGLAKQIPGLTFLVQLPPKRKKGGTAKVLAGIVAVLALCGVVVWGYFVYDPVKSAVRLDFNAFIANTKGDGSRTEDAVRQFLREQADEKLARWEKAASNGLPEGAYLLAACYECGIGIDKNSQQAYEWLKKSAEGGLAEAQFGYAVVSKSLMRITDSEAEKWIRKAAAQGHQKAQAELTDIENGKELQEQRGIPQVSSRQAPEAARGTPEGKRINVFDTEPGSNQNKKPKKTKTMEGDTESVRQMQQSFRAAFEEEMEPEPPTVQEVVGGLVKQVFGQPQKKDARPKP